MKRLLLILLFASLAGSFSKSFSMPIDTNVFKYFPLNTGNKWTWYIDQNFSPGPGYESLTILNNYIANNHVYYRGRRHTYIIYNNQHYISTVFYRIDSLTGNLYSYDSLNNRDCLSDSLNSRINDSARVGCGSPELWYRYDTSSYSIFNQNFQTKVFSWSNYFEAGGQRKYSKNIGRVYEWDQYHMAHTAYFLRGCLINEVLYGDTTLVGMNQISTEIAKQFSLSQNYPNPFNPVTNVKFQIPKSDLVRLIVYDAIGREIQTLVNQELLPGTYEVGFDGSNLPSGVYYYKLESGESTETKKMVLIK